MDPWLVLTATLPTSPSALRVRTWRALKATGAGTLREGVHVLPASAPTASALWCIDRLATAWLVTRFVDPAATFHWLDRGSACPKGAVGFDFDGAAFTHVGDKVTFEVFVDAFGLDADAALQRMGALVHDVDGTTVDAGIETLVRGLLACHGDDDALLAAALPLFDALYAALRDPS